MKKFIFLILGLIMLFMIVPCILSYDLSDNENITVHYNFSNNFNDYFGIYNLSTVGNVQLNNIFPTYNNTGDGSPNSSLFDGDGDALKSTFAPESRSYSISLWFNSDITQTADDYNVLFRWGDSTNENIFFYYGGYGNNVIRIRIFHSGGNSYKDISISYLADTWYHIVVTVDDVNDILKFYSNGMLIDSITFPTSSPNINSVPFVIGDKDSSLGVSEGFDGNIDEVTIFKKTLDISEVQNIFNLGMTKSIILSPSVLISYPENDTNFNSDFNINFTHIDGGINSTCNLYFNDIINKSYFIATGNYSIMTDGFNIQGNITIKINCSNSEDTGSDSVNIFFDNTVPVIDYARYKLLEGTGGNLLNAYLNEFYFNISVSDDNLYLYNRTIINSSRDIINNSVYRSGGSSNYIDNDFFNTSNLIDGTYFVNLSVCDAHTDSDIGSFLTTPLIDGIDIEGIKLTSKDAKLQSITADKFSDRYKFTVNTKENIYQIILKVTAKNKIVPYNSKYQGHFILDDKYWIDFVSKDVKVKSTRRVSNTEYEITLESLIPINKISFDSIGLINCIYAEYEINLFNYPYIDFVSQNPNNVPFLYFQNVTIQYNSSDLSGIDYVKLFYFTNNSDFYLNGIKYENRFNETSTDINGDLYNFTLFGDNFQPSSMNYFESVFINTVHQTYNLDTDNKMIKARIFNVSNNKQYNVLEVMANSTTDYNIYYCNENYVSGSVLTSPYCTLVGTVPSNTPYNHTHGGYSMHLVLPMVLDNGTFNGVPVTPTSYFIIRGISNVYYISNISSSGVMQYSGNSGVTWSGVSGTVDLHIHQYNGNETLTYRAYSCDTAGYCSYSNYRYDLLDTAGLNLENVNILSPKPITYYRNYFTNITSFDINYTKSLNLNLDEADNYDLILFNSTRGYLEFIFDNDFNLNYLYENLNMSLGSYIIGVNASLGSESIITYSETFTVATSTTSSTTSTTYFYDRSLEAGEFSSTPQALTYIFLYILWIVMIYFSYTVKGSHGKTPMILVFMQMIIGIVAGWKCLNISWLVGFGTIIISIVLFFGKAIEK